MELPELPPPPPEIPPNVFPIRVKQPETEKKKAPGFKGKRVSLLTNHFRVAIGRAAEDFYHYHIWMVYEDGHVITNKNVKRAVVGELVEAYKSELAAKNLFYDGDQSLFTLGALPENRLEFSVVMNPSNGSSHGVDGEEDQKRRRLAPRSKVFKVKISFVSRITMQPLNEGSLRALDFILQQTAAKRGCLVLGQSYFMDEASSYIDVGGGVLGCRGFFSSFRALQGGLFLNHDVCMTTTVQPGLVVTFLMSSQNVNTPFKIDWNKAIQTLKNMRFRVKHLNSEFKIRGLSERTCKEQKFSLRFGEASENGRVRAVETTVYDYFVTTRGIELKFSESFPCINAGKPNSPVFFPIELCYLVPLQRNRNELTGYQKAAMVTKSSRKPEDLVKILADGAKRITHEAEPLLQSCGISINGSLVQAEGRVLPAPRLKMGNLELFFARNAWWSIKDKKLMEPKGLVHWTVVNFSTSCDARKTCLELANISSAKGVNIRPPLCVLEENPKYKKKPPSVRVEMMFQQLQSRFRQHPPHFILCLLSDKKSSDLYGPWKRRTLVEFGIPDQCMSSTKIDELYLMNLLLKINVKIGGLNHAIDSEFTRNIPLVSKIPTMILGIHVFCASPARADAPSIASVVGSREWPRISRYRASLSALPPKAQIIESLFKPMSQQEDAGMIRLPRSIRVFFVNFTIAWQRIFSGEKIRCCTVLLLEFHASSGQKKPAQIVVFRNGLSKSQFGEFLSVEMDQIRKACNFLDASWRPKFTAIVSQRRHHTKFFDANLGANVPPGTVVEKQVCDLQCTNFYMCAHTARIGTSRPTHYHILLDEIGFSSDEIQEVIHSLSYVFQRSNRAISEVAPVRYARLAAAQMSQVIKHDDFFRENGYRLPKIHRNVASSMFFI